MIFLVYRSIWGRESISADPSYQQGIAPFSKKCIHLWSVRLPLKRPGKYHV